MPAGAVDFFGSNVHRGLRFVRDDDDGSGSELEMEEDEDVVRGTETHPAVTRLLLCKLAVASFPVGLDLLACEAQAGAPLVTSVACVLCCVSTQKCLCREREHWLFSSARCSICLLGNFQSELLCFAHAGGQERWRRDWCTGACGNSSAGVSGPRA